jgi:hypothetical protein
MAALLQAWQRDTAILWQLPHAVPTPASFVGGPDLAPGRSNTVAADAGEWSALWSEADRSLYGTAPLPADWTSRAAQALAARPAPAFSAFQLFLPRNLLPLLALGMLILGPGGHTALSAAESTAEPPPPGSPVAADGSTDARTAYARAAFPAAETAWRDALKAAPTDWTAHHNLALALIQQNRPGEAAGHALAAYVQHPQNPSVRWHLAYAFHAAAVTPPALKPFLTDSPAAALARLASPTRWQITLIASAWLTALALSIGLHCAYQKRRRTLLTGGLLAGSLLLAAAAGVSLHTYGTLADARAVVVVAPTTLRSIPTDLDAPQKSTPLAIGVIATTDKTFLGWRRLAFSDGQTGWVRAETLVPLWN